MHDNERQMWNRELALAYVKAGIPIFPTDPDKKVPLVKRFTQLDDEIPQDDKDTLNAAKHAEDIAAGREPKDLLHIGCTIHPEVIRRMWRAHPNATPSISTGPAGLIVVDADIKEGVDGPAKLREFFAPLGGIPKTASVVITQSGGLHVYFRNTAKLGCRKGAFTDLKCDVRGIGGQVVAPGAIREDGKTYLPDVDYARLIVALPADELCDCPQAVIDMIGKKAERAEDSKLTTEHESELQTILEDSSDESFIDLFVDDVVRIYNLDALAEKDQHFKTLYAQPTEDTSENRFQMARKLRAEWPKMSISHYATFLDNWDGAGTYVEDQPKKGEYNDRSIKREYIKSENEFKTSDTKNFGAVDDEPYVYTIKTPKSVLHKLRDALNDMVQNWVPMPWLVKGMIPAKGVGVLYGRPNVGKSFIGIDLSCRVGNGIEWMGHKVEQAGVLYLYSEGEDGLAGRFKAWADRHPGKRGNVMVAKVPNIYEDPNAVKKVISLGNAAAEHIGAPIGLVIVDTLAASSAGADENSAGDMGVLFKRFGMISDALNASVLVVHHVTKSTGSMRGSGAIEGAIDYSLEATEVTAKGTSPTTRLKAVKLRDAAKNREGIPFKLEIVVIGKDKDGEDVTSCVVKTLGLGSTLDVVADEGESQGGPQDEPGTTDDGLTPEQNDAAEAKRVEACEQVAAWVRTQPGQRANLHDARVEVPVLAKLYRQGPTNFVAKINVDLMDALRKATGADVGVDQGRLHFIKSGSRFAFKFVPSG